MQIPAQTSALAARSDASPLDILLRLSALALSVLLFILTLAQAVLSDYWLYFLASPINIFCCQTTTLVRVYYGVKAPWTRPVTIALDLFLMAIAASFTTGIGAIVLSSSPLRVGDALYRECGKVAGDDVGAPCAAHYVGSLRLAITSGTTAGLIT